VRFNNNPVLLLLFSLLLELFLFVPSNAAQSPPVLPMVHQICGQCHALRINDDCVAGDCQTVRVFPTGPRQWLPLVNWIRRYVGCPMTDDQQQTIIHELNEHYPVPSTPLAWNESQVIPAAGRVTALLALKEARYLGTDHGRILQSVDHGPWRTVAEVGPLTISALTVFHDTVYAATNLPRGEVWNSRDGTEWKKAADLTEISGGLISLQVIDDQLYAGTAQGRVLRSSDGITWSPMPVIATGMGSAWVSALQSYQGYLYAGMALGDLFRTRPGEPWSTAAFPQPPGQSSMGFNAASVFAGGLYFGPTTRAEVWRTDGARWQKLFEAAPGRQGGTVAALAATQGALYAAMTLPDETSHLYRTRNGLFWEEVAPPQPTGRILKLAGLSDRLVAAVQEGERILIVEAEEPAPASRQGEFVIYAAPGTQEHPSVASDGKNLFMIWHSQEEGQSTITYDIYGALLDPNGRPVGTVPIKISTARESQAWANLTFGGGHYFAVWTDSRHDGFEIYGARIDSKGRVMDSDGIAIAPGKTDHEAPEVAWDGRSFLVVWHQTQGQQDTDRYDIYGRRMKPDGTPLDDKPFPIATGPKDQTFPQIASSGRESLVVWTDRRLAAEENIFAARVDQSGKVLDPEGIPITTASNNQNYPSVGWNGRQYLVAWVDQRDSSIRAARVAPDGTVLDPEGIAVSDAPVVHAFPDVACLETGVCVVIWEQTSPVPGERDVRAARVAPDGRILDRDIAVSVYPGQQRFSTVYPLPNRRGFLGAWEDFPIWDTGDIFAKMLTFPR
jgi:hypothetical protein